MRICMVMSASFPPREGIGFYVLNLSRQLMKLGHQVQIVTRGKAESTSWEVIDDVTVWRPTFLPLYPFHVHFHDIFLTRLVQELNSEVDIFHFHTPLVKYPQITLPSLVTVHAAMKGDVAAVKADNLIGILAKLQAPFSYRIEQELFERSGKITAVSNSIANEMQLYGIDPEQVAVLGNGADTNIFFPVEGVYNPERPYFLTVGRLGPRKGLEDLLEAAEIVVKQFPGIRFLIAGSGPLESRLRNSIKNRELDGKVQLLGHIADRTKLADLYRGAIAYVHPAHYEGLPTVLLEAMACGRAVVATAVSGALDVVQDGKNGLLVPSKAPGQLAKAIMRLFQEPGFAAALGNEAHNTIENAYSWHAVSRNYVTQYENLLQGVRA